MFDIYKAFKDANKFKSKKNITKKMRSITNAKIKKNDMVMVVYAVNAIHGTEIIFEPTFIKYTELNHVHENYTIDEAVSFRTASTILVNNKIKDEYFKIKLQ